MPKPNKYHNNQISTLYGQFDSKKEYNHFIELKAQEDAGKIQNLERQVEYVLIPKQKISKGTLRGIKYVADFRYIKDGETVVEDIKPTDRAGNVSKSYKKTAAWKEYMLKKKLMKFVHDIEVMEV